MKLGSGNFYGRRLKFASIAGFNLTKQEYQSNDRLPKHSHEFPHFCLTIDGSHTEQFLGQEVEHHPIDLTFCPPDFEHSELHHTQGCHFVIEVEPWRFESIKSGRLIFSESKVIDDGVSPGLAAKLYREFQEDDPFSKLAMEGIALELLAHSMRRESQSKFSASKQQQRLNQVLEILQQCFPVLPSLGSIAGTVGIHPVYLATTFRKSQGCTIGEYIRRQRVKHACRRIISSNDPLVEIALESGFTDQTHLCRSFKRVMGMTPAQYRRAFRPY